MCESFFATLECELLARHKFHSQAQAMPIVFEFLEGWYNTHRRHSALGQIAPLEFERRHEGRSEAVAPKIDLQGSRRIDEHVHP
jgi:putative transposase